AIDAATRRRAEQVLKEAGLDCTFAQEAPATGSVVYIGVNGSGGAADQRATALALDRTNLTKAGKFDRHLLSLSDRDGSAEVVIVGENSDAAFFALASLEQMIEHGTEHLPEVKLYDYADQQSRGLVEGYYGYPYSVAVKKDLMRFMMRMKMNTYMYGAKSDVYHSQKWEAPYPATLTPQQVKNGLLTQDMIRDIAKTSQDTKVNFIWAIHPGDSFVGDANVVNRIMNKYSRMYELGVRQFAVFVDDVGVPKSEADCKTNADHLTALQAAIDKKWNNASASPEARVRPLHFVPQVYTLSWVGEADRKRFYNALSKTPDKITIYITGWGVWTVPNSNDLDVVRKELQRPAAWWWNYPCNDNADGQIYPSDMYYNFFEMPAVDNNAKMPKQLEHGLGIVSNPMQEGEVAKTALFSVADYAWNNAAFDNMKSWNASFSRILSSPEQQQAYKTIIPYLRWNDAEDMQQAIVRFKSGKTDKMKQLVERLLPAAETMLRLKDSSVENERLLYNDLAPWLLKLHAMLRIAGQMVEVAESNEPEVRWEEYVKQLDRMADLDVNTDYTAYALEGLGSGISVSQRQSQPSQKYFYPFMNYLRENGLGRQPFGKGAEPVQAVSSVSGVSPRVVQQNGETYFNGVHVSVPSGDFVGLTFAEPFTPAEMRIDATLLSEWAVQWSEDGKNWNRMRSTTWPEGKKMKYVVLINNQPETRTLTLTRSNFSVLLPQLPTLSAVDVPTDEVGEATNNQLGKRALIDGDPSTFFAGKRNQMKDDRYVVHLQKPTDVKDVRIYFGTKNGDQLQAGTVEASVDGTVWKQLHVAGSVARAGGMAQSKPYADQVRYVDFEGDVPGANQVRLTVSSPIGNKWLRLYDVQVNALYQAAQYAPAVVDGRGKAHPEVTDGKGYNALTQAGGGELRYEIRTLAELKAVDIYWNPAVWKAAEKPELEWTADGKTWQSLGQLSAALTRVAAAQMPEATALRLRWAGQQVPAVYQMVSVTDPTVRRVEPTALKSAQADRETGKALEIYDLNGKLLRSDGNTTGLRPGIYVVAGRKITLY
ncbi:MAG: beta-N-acetylglucosaminidase domain-containing protein, partial [Prevotellaceae bacterium]|nr:beta-N-acetylglucosaminidase domain-containing protein [Prevotellaceae bacterium]